MDRATFEEQATEFAQEIATLLDVTLVGEITANTFEINEEKLRAVIKRSKQLEIGRSNSKKLQLACEFRLCTNSTKKHLAIESSTFKVQYQSGQKYRPVVRFEYDRNSRNKPASHFQFHSDSVPLGLLLARAGNYDAAAQQQDIHYPMGDERFRVCLEDVIELLANEFNAQTHDGWQQHIERGRNRYLSKQAETVIRKNPDLAIKLLEQQGYKVKPPARYPLRKRLKSRMSQIFHFRDSGRFDGSVKNP